MQPLPFDIGSALVRQHMEDLQREAALRRLVRRGRRQKPDRSEESHIGLRPAAASRSN